MLLEVGATLNVAESGPSSIRFGEEPKQPGQRAGRRLLWNGDKAAFNLSFWCGTCPLIFERLEGATETVPIPEVQSQLNSGLEHIDEDVLQALTSRLPAGPYVPLLLEVHPELVFPGKPRDYFSNEQVYTWGLSGFWGLPEYPSTPYYRTWQAPVDGSGHAFEFVVPMVPPTWNDSGRVADYAGILEKDSTPTAVAVSVLDVCQPAVDNGSDYYVHWGLVHFLLDGHHKMQAAAESGRPLRLLSLLAIEDGLSSEDKVDQIVKLRANPPAPRRSSQ